MKLAKRLAALLTIAALGAAAPAALADPPGPGEKQCKPGKQNPHCPASQKTLP